MSNQPPHAPRRGEIEETNEEELFGGTGPAPLRGAPTAAAAMETPAATGSAMTFQGVTLTPEQLILTHEFIRKLTQTTPQSGGVPPTRITQVAPTNLFGTPEGGAKANERECVEIHDKDEDKTRLANVTRPNPHPTCAGVEANSPERAWSRKRKRSS
jgi:hypothetical protein